MSEKELLSIDNDTHNHSILDVYMLDQCIVLFAFSLACGFPIDVAVPRFRFVTC